MKLKISLHEEPAYSFDLQRDFGYVGFDLWRFCFFLRYRKPLKNKEKS